MGDPRLCRAQLPPGRLGVGCACVVLFYEGDTRDHEDRGRKPLEAVLAALTRAYLAYSPTEPRMAIPGRPLPHTLREIPLAPVLEPPRAVKLVTSSEASRLHERRTPPSRVVNYCRRSSGASTTAAKNRVCAS
jgi:hypothetical protein